MVQKGVTLIELIVVLTIMGIIGMGAQFAIGSRTKSDLTAWAQQIKNDIRYCQRMAMAENRDYIMMFDSSTSSYDILAATPSGGKKVIKDVILDKDVIINKMEPVSCTFQFTNTGTINSGFTITLKKNSQIITLTGTVGGGRVEIK